MGSPPSVSDIESRRAMEGNWPPGRASQIALLFGKSNFIIFNKQNQAFILFIYSFLRKTKRFT
jgi:hypothetical protein